MKPYVLLAVTGMSPQVVTETLYALHKQRKPMPKAVQLITTARGKQQAWLTLGVGENKQGGQLQQFYKDYGYDPVPFNEENIWIVENSQGEPLDDVISESDHRAMADFITSKVANLTKYDNTALHASLAGGRKTMTFFMGYAMSLYGRKDDQLSHVLVSAGFEGLRGFFYPTPYDKPLNGFDGVMLNGKDAKVLLADIPFVRMREDVPAHLLDGSHRYSEVIDLLNQSNAEPSLMLSMTKKSVTCGSIEVRLPPMEMSFYCWLARRRKKGLPGLAIPNEIGEKDYISAFIAEYSLITDEFKADEKRENVFATGMTKSFFLEKKSKVTRLLVDALGEKGAKAYLPKDIADDVHSKYKLFGIGLEPNQITFEE